MFFFTDFSFWLVFVLFLTLYALIRGCWRVGMLLYVVAFSLSFFWMTNGWLSMLLPAVALITWLTGRVLADTLLPDGRALYPILRRLTLAAAIVLVLLPLVYFKYSGFLLSTVNGIFSTNFSVRMLAQPVGISFFSFQAISYLIDVYRGKFRMQVSLLEYLFYLSFFPLVLAGPITRADTLLPQLRRVGQVSHRLLYVGVWLILLGLLKKCVIADYISQYNDWIFSDPVSYSGYECMMGILGYSVQIYCDFSGYSDMSIGIAAMMGFRLSENFAFPYRSSNLSQFWRRWHISLSFWFRDYLYIPMGGNRCSRARTYINNIITMLVAGLWHGASWMFVLWGGLHGLGLVIHKMSMPWLRRLPNFWLTRMVCVSLTFVYVCVAWVFFRSDSVSGAWLLLHRSFANFDIAYFTPFLAARPWWCAMVFVVLLTQFISDHGFIRLQTRFVCLPWWAKTLLVLVVFQLMLQFRTSNVQPFIYYQF